MDYLLSFWMPIGTDIFGYRKFFRDSKVLIWRYCNFYFQVYLILFFSSAVKTTAAFPSPDTDLRNMEESDGSEKRFFPKANFLQVSDYENVMWFIHQAGGIDRHIPLRPSRSWLVCEYAAFCPLPRRISIPSGIVPGIWMPDCRLSESIQRRHVACKTSQ
jgi:hypothetical protein